MKKRNHLIEKAKNKRLLRSAAILTSFIVIGVVVLAISKASTVTLSIEA